MNQKEITYVVFNKTESLAESVLKDIISLVVVSLLVYISRGSTWWTLVTGTIFIMWSLAKISATMKSRQKRFNTKAEMQAWLDAID
jgi:ABC-type bacteriocin/lantibiotic exporter with double-glycine peptidase domain